MKTYSDFVDRLFIHEDDLLGKLVPTEAVDYGAVAEIKKATDAEIAGGKKIGDLGMFTLVRGGLLYAYDEIHEAHRIFQDAPGDLGSYWHGMMHRREGDFDNARYWFRRAGSLAFFGDLQRAASQHSAVMARQSNWDPYLFTGECEQARYGDADLLKELVQLQRAEFQTLFDYCWRGCKLA